MRKLRMEGLVAALACAAVAGSRAGAPVAALADETAGEVGAAQAEYGAMSISNAVVELYKTSFVYTSNEVPQNVIVKLNGETLTKDVDYTVEYDGLIEVGTHTATITGIGNYNGKITYSFEIVHIQYPDVPLDSWVVQGGYIDTVSCLSLMTGYSNGNFGPNDAVTRGQVATVIYRYATSDYQGGGTSTTFSDVPSGAYYTAAVEWCYANGIVTGYGDTGTFGPENAVTREELATMLARFAAWYGISTTEGDTSSFPDAASISDFAKEAVGWCNARGIMTGDSVTHNANPKDGATRAQMAKMLAVFVTDVNPKQ